MEKRIVDRTHSILRENGIYAKKKFGQNFLVSSRVLEETIEKSGINKETYVIEIGMGLGTLTEYLAINSCKVLSYDVDPDMYKIASVNLQKYNNMHLKLQDFLEADLDRDIEEYLDNASEVVVIANIPYYITTPIAFKLLENPKIKDIYLMMQQELADRFRAKPNSKDYSSLSALIAYKGEAKKVLTASRNCFYPVPRVDSSLLNIKITKSDFRVKNEADFLKYLRDIFSQKRKTVVNNISQTRSIEKGKVIEALKTLNLKETSRAEEMDIELLLKFYKELIER